MLMVKQTNEKCTVAVGKDGHRPVAHRRLKNGAARQRMEKDGHRPLSLSYPSLCCMTTETQVYKVCLCHYQCNKK